MDFSLTADQEALREGIRDFCDKRLSLAELRSIEKEGIDRDLWSEFAEMGILGLRVPEDSGGIGLGLAEAVLVFEELGRCVAPGPLLWSHLAAGWIEGAASGEVIVTGLDLRGRGEAPLMVEHLELADVLLILRHEGVERFDCREVEGVRLAAPLDPFTPISRVDCLPPGSYVGDGDLARKLVCEGTVLIAGMRLGIAEATQTLATAYAAEREQFGRSVGSFQAIKHILADCFVRQELARASAYAAGVLMDDGVEEEAHRAVAAAALISAEAAMKNARACIQVHGGMGYTWENPAHYYLKRAWILDNTLGRGGEQAELLAEQIAADA